MRAPPFEEALFAVDIDARPTARRVPRARRQLSSRELSEEGACIARSCWACAIMSSKHGFPGVVMGLSGGIDSALTLAIAVDALGAERVQAVMMPSRYTSQMSPTTPPRRRARSA